jgi:hypothetical protein
MKNKGRFQFKFGTTVEDARMESFDRLPFEIKAEIFALLPLPAA